MATPSIPVDTRSLDEIYAAALKESGPLIVAAGGDGEPSHASAFDLMLVSMLNIAQLKPNGTWSVPHLPIASQS